jgi:putative nucleotide binding protein
MSEKDEYLLALDFLEHGHSDEREERVVQGIGKDNYTLLEAVMREDERPKGGEELYIGQDDRPKVEFIKNTVEYEDLTASAQNELKYVLKEIVRQKENEFIEFFNEAGPVTPRRHAFELLPGIGTKTMRSLLDERESSEFESFDDIEERVPSAPDPAETIEKRIMNELKGETKNRLLLG